MHIIKPHEVLSFIAPYLPHNPCIIEAGAFDGKDTLKIITQFPHATIHAFEPIPSLYDQVRDTIKNNTTVHVYNCALSNKNGTATLHVAEKKERPGKPSQPSSLHAPQERIHHSPIHFPCTLTVPTTTIDSWAQKNNISKIDMLWLDAQGHEQAILQGAMSFLPTISIIHTEVYFIQAYESHPLYDDIKAWLAEHNFVEIARDFSNTTDWFFGNSIFLNTDLM